MKKKLLLGLALGLGTFSFAQCDISGVSPVMCLTDTPVAMDVASPGAVYDGPGVSGDIFSPSEAGIGTHTITVEAPGEGYSVDETIDFDPIAIPGGTSVSLSDDNVSPFLPIGFDFTFFGVTHDQFRIGSNGFITFNGSSASGCCSGQNIPNTSFPNELIAFSWEDLDPGNGGAPAINLVRYETVGVAPNRVLVVEFFNVDHYSSGDRIYCHTQLYETTNCVEIHLGLQPAVCCNHTMGIENAAGTEAYAASGKNAASWTASDFAISFCPNIGCEGTFEVEVVEAPSVTATIDEEEICLGEEVTITAGGDADSYYLGAGILDGVPFTPETAGENVFVVAGSDDGGCVATAMVSVFVHDIPYVYAGDDFTTCEDDEFVLEAIGDEATYVWDGGVEDGVSMMQDAGTVTYTVTGTNSGGCEASSSVTVEALEVPTGTGVVTMMTGVAYDGEIDFTPSGGTGGPYTFLWSNGETTEDITALGVGSYTVIVSDGMCDSEVTFFVDSQAGIALNELDNLSVYPNPVIDFVTVEFDGTYNWTLFDNAGKIVSSGTATGKEHISMENLATGNYMMNVEVDGKKSTVAVVKK
ncbi:MAG: T9SS type A sorting domain-containing protein [Crocinitomicaceae bacterium]|nr:T9SS type A sorting domain-containing protein [Crocinitomix sp.]MDG2440916.1 T9SS type A sorting domain-containing protein [Crocinitomicaceae bacterium]